MKVTFCDRCGINIETERATSVDVALQAVQGPFTTSQVVLTTLALNLCKDDYDEIAAALQTKPSEAELKRRAEAKAKAEASVKSEVR